MSNYDTMNPVPSTDPRDLDDNATVFDSLLQSSSPSVPDRLGVQRKTWSQMEADAAALVSPNVSALAAAVSAANKLFYFTGSGAGTVTDLSAFARTLLDDADAAAMRTTIGSAPLASPSFTGTPSGTTAAVDTNTTQLATTAFVLAQAASATPLGDGSAAVGTSTRFARGDHVHPTDTSRAPLASPTFTGTPAAPTAAVGTNTTQLATAAMIQAEIANKRSWTSYTPTVTANVNTFTSASATGKYMVMFGLCFVQINITITTKGTGSDPKVTLPVAALSGTAGHIIPCREEMVNGLSGNAIILSALNIAQVTTSTNSNMATADGCVIHIQGFYPVA